MQPPIRTLGVIGTGVIGAGWAARALAHGLDVVAWDPAPGWQGRLTAAVGNAWPALEKVGLYPDARPDRLHCADSLGTVCRAADFIQESAPERLELKQSLHEQIDLQAPPEVIVASSTSGLLPSDLQSRCRHPERLVVGHPFNPVYLLPLVEVLGGNRTSSGSIDCAMEFYRDLGMHPLKVRTEIEGFLSDRLQEALWRELLHLVNDGVATTDELDAAIVYGPGLRWAFMGTCLTYHLAGGDAGMDGFLKQFGPTLELPWTRMPAPELSDELIDRMADGANRQAEGRTVKELERLRDDCLVAIVQALKRFEVGAGRTLAEDEARRGKGQAS
ncbi:MAG: L-carnitine dehydrogenase [Gammaproteobacteria bacterium]|nr:L-carnitine dehydrogenase [Gammaproteobacteria bacterium]MYH86021.1 L-carnitine dehydrogenase [Gammaproteobacteria bacterium]MYK04120.1 L-carnitine dehydrogenase [Gammaproteobacteria bacterium]